MGRYPIKSPFRGEARWIEKGLKLPLIPLPEACLFPGHVIPMPNGGPLGGADLEQAHADGLRVGIVPVYGVQFGASADELPLSAVGTEAIITGMMRLPNGETAAMVKGLRRFVLKDVKARSRRSGPDALTGVVDTAEDLETPDSKHLRASTRALKEAIVRVLKMNGTFSSEAAALVAATDDAALLCDLIAPHLSLGFEQRLKVLRIFRLPEKIRVMLRHLARETSLLELSGRIRGQVQEGLKENQKRQFLQEQIRTLKEELGELDGTSSELEELEQDIEDLDLPDEVRDAAMTEIERMELMPPGSPEYMVSYTYVTWIRDLPWGEGEIPKPPTLPVAQKLLDREHFGLEKVKERILEYLAVMRHRGQERGEILLLAGPPGVGKTSLAKSVAAALGRPFVRISLGGVKDEAEIRGHRRTYIGSMPGKVLQAIKQAESQAPVILLDEIDKVGLDAHGRGDLASALLEVLDSEQNKGFVDHYLGVPFDLSGVVFIATANELEPLSKPLLDRMELVTLSSYTEPEKLSIARKHLIPRIRREMRLSAREFAFSESTLKHVIRHYTREAGVRGLQRELTRIARKVVKRKVEGSARLAVSRETMTKYLGQPKYFEEPRDKKLLPGVAIGLAYTSVGGEILYIESSRSLDISGKGGFSLTGSLGKVMRESALAALSYLTSYAQRMTNENGRENGEEESGGHGLALDLAEIRQSQIHLHLPDGATPKDGPSAGVAIMCALASLFSGRCLPADLAMTGEITLRGQVLAVGGIREKVLAAHRYGKRRVMLPRSNWHDLMELPPEIQAEMDFIPVETMEEVLRFAGLIQPGDAAPKARGKRSRRLPVREIPLVPRPPGGILQ